MQRITIGKLFEDFSAANQVVDELLKGGFKRNQVSIVLEPKQVGLGQQPEIQLQGVRNLTIPGLGQALAAGPLAEEVGEAGDLGKWLEAAGISPEFRQKCLQAMRSGHILVVVQTGENKASDAVSYLSGTHGSGGGIGEIAPKDMILSADIGDILNRFRIDDDALKSDLEGGTHGPGPGIDE